MFLLLILTGLTTAEYRILPLTSLCRKFSSSWAGVYSLSVISLTSPQEAIIVRLDQAELSAPLSCDLHFRSSRTGLLMKLQSGTFVIKTCAGLGFSLDFPRIEIPRTVGDYQCDSYLLLETQGAQTDRLCGHHGSDLNTGSAGPSNNQSKLQL